MSTPDSLVPEGESTVPMSLRRSLSWYACCFFPTHPPWSGNFRGGQLVHLYTLFCLVTPHSHRVSSPRLWVSPAWRGLLHIYQHLYRCWGPHGLQHYLIDRRRNRLRTGYSLETQSSCRIHGSGRLPRLDTDVSFGSVATIHRVRPVTPACGRW